MKYNVNSYSDVETQTTTVEKNITLAKDSATIIFQMFSKNIYTNPIGSVVREITSNCFDSHVEAGVKTPVIIKKIFDKQANNYYVSFIDYGVGMSTERIDNVFSVMFSSTKREDIQQIGQWGLGSKSPLAYKRSTGFGEGEYDNSYFIITIFDNIKYTYQIYENKNSPVISLLHSEKTDEHNGTEVRIPVLEKDLQTFTKEMVRQLYYFENVVFEGFDEDDDNSTRYDKTLTNKYQIIRGKSFLFRGDDYYGNIMHVCLGKVAYPIDYNILNLNSSDYQLPIALKLEVGEVGVNISRETLDYDENTIKILKKKLEAAKKEIIALISKQYQNVQTLEEYFSVKQNFGVLNFSNGSSINTGKLIKQSDVDFPNFKYGFMKMPSDKHLFKFFFKSRIYGKKPRRSRWSSTGYEFDGGYDELHKNKNLLYIEDMFVRKIVKQAYLKSLYKTYHIIEKNNIISNSSSLIQNDVADLFHTQITSTCDDKGKPTTYMQSLLEMQEEYFEIIRKHAQNYDTLEVPEDFVIDRKKNSMSKDLRNTTIPVKFVGGYSKYRIKLESLFDYNCPIFYGNQADESKLHEIYRIFTTLFGEDVPVTYYSDYDHQFSNRRSGASKKSIMFIILAENNLKYMQYCKKAYKVDDFFNKILYRKSDTIMQYFQTNMIIEKYNQIHELYTNKSFVMINAKWGKKINDVKAGIAVIPAKSRENKIANIQPYLSTYFDLSNIKITAAQKKLEKQIDEVLALQAKNEKVLQYINLPYRMENFDDKLITILQVVMEF
jgi:hypothetical protein